MTAADLEKQLNRKAMYDLAFRVIDDMGAALIISLGYIGDKLGIFKAMAGSGKLTSRQLSEKTKLNERYVREWAKAMVAAEYIEYDPHSDTYFMTAEQTTVLTDENSAAFVGGAFQLAAPSILHLPRIIEAFQNGKGISYDEMGEEIPRAIANMFRPGYKHKLASTWFAAMPEVEAKLKKGGSILDIGCGCGQSTIALAKAFPKAKIVGIDPHKASIDEAVQSAKDERLSNVEFRVLQAHEVATTEKYDLVCAFDCIHDMVNPRETLERIRELLKSDGALFWIEPNASDNPLENRNIVGKCYAAISPHHCLTVSLAHDGEGLGTTIGERGAEELARAAGFSSFTILPVEEALNKLYLVSP